MQLVWLCRCAHKCFWCVCLCVHCKAREESPLSCFHSACLIPWRQGFSLNLELDWVTRKPQWSYLHTLQHWGYRYLWTHLDIFFLHLGARDLSSGPLHLDNECIYHWAICAVLKLDVLMYCIHCGMINRFVSLHNSLLALISFQSFDSTSSTELTTILRVCSPISQVT